MADQELAEGLKSPPVSRSARLYPPQTIIWLPVHTAVWSSLAPGRFVPVEVVVHVLPAISYLPPSSMPSL